MAELCVLNSLFYKPGTKIPFTQRYGPNAILFNHSTSSVVVIDSNGMVSLENGCVYSIEEPSSEFLRLIKGPQQPRGSEGVSDRSFFRTLGRGKRDSVVSTTKLFSGSKSSIGTLKSPTESVHEEEPPQITKQTSTTKLFSKRLSSFISPSEEATTNSGSSIFTLSRKHKRSSVQINGSASNSTGDIATKFSSRESRTSIVGGVKQSQSEGKISKSVERLAEESEDDDPMDLVDFLKGLPAKPKPASNPELKKDVAQSSTDIQETTSRLSMSSVGSSSVLDSNPKLYTREKNGSTEFADHRVSVQSSNSLFSSPFKSKSPMTLMEALETMSVSNQTVSDTQSVNGNQHSSAKGISKNGSQVHQAPLAAIIEGTLLDSIGYPIYVQLFSNRISIFADEDSTSSGKPLFDIVLDNCYAVPIPNTANEFEIKHQSGILKLATSSHTLMMTWICAINSTGSDASPLFSPAKILFEDMHQELFLKEFPLLLDEVRSQSNIDDEVALSLANGWEIISTVAPSIARQNSLDSSTNEATIKYEPDADGTQTPYHISAASLDKVVERMADIHGPDDSYISLILHTHRHFISTAELINKLSSRLHPLTNTGSTISAKWKPIIKERVISVVLKWITLLWSPDFVTQIARESLDVFLKSILGSFGNTEEDAELDSAHGEQFKLLAGHFAQIVSKKAQEYEQTVQSQLSTVQTEKSKKQFIDLDPIDVAKHLTIHEFQLFSKIKPISLMARLWQDEKIPEIARVVAPINDMVNYFNTISYWVATEVCTQPEMKNRCKVIEKLIKVAKETRRMENFNTTMAIVSGLNLVAVSRLKSTWEEIDGKRARQLEDLETLLSPMNNFKIYRAMMEELEQSKTRTRCIPIISLFLKDLLFFNDGNPKNTPKGLVSIDKVRSIDKKIVQFLVPQAIPSSLDASATNEDVRHFCQNLRALKEPALYKYSCLCEPKSGDDVLRLREKWMTGK